MISYHPHDHKVDYPHSTGMENEAQRRGLTPWVSLECNPKIPVAPGEKNSVLDTNLDELYFALQ